MVFKTRWNRQSEESRFPIKLLAVSTAIFAMASSSFVLAEKTGNIKMLTSTQTSKISAKYRAAPADTVIEGQYIVVYKNDTISKKMTSLAKQSFSKMSAASIKSFRRQAVMSKTQELAGTYGAEVKHHYHGAISGFVTKMERRSMENLLLDDSIEYIEADQIVRKNEIQFNATFGLDRIDQENLPLNGQYEFNLDGTGVDAFILDTGILSSHSNFGGRVSGGFTSINDGRGTEDCDGHGTHVAGTVGSETFGVAKNVNLIPVRVLGCDGSGSNSGVIAGVDFVAQNADGPTVANMSLGGGNSRALDNAVQNAIDAGITFVVAAGNDNSDACIGSPNRLPDAITVASSTSTDQRSGFSNFGSCVDIFAPGSRISSTFNNGGFATLSGTSMASPHVAGVAALVLQANPTASPSEVESIIESAAAVGKISDVQGSPNLLVQTEFDAIVQPTPTPAPGDCFHQATFESGSDGWTTSGSSCSTGSFGQGTPNQTSNGATILQVGGAASGSGAWFTSPNSSLGVNDVDGGTCETRSPSIDASSAQTADISLSFFHGQRDAGDDDADGFVIDVLNDGVVVETMVNIGDVTNEAAWSTINTTITNPGDIQLRVRASDAAGPGDIVEAGIDDVLICPGEAPAEPECDVDESFETGSGGWSNSAASTCATGTYVIGTPSEQVNSGVTTQLSGANTGNNAVFTATNTSAGVNDVDGGNCIANSPVYDVTSDSTLSVAFFHGQRDAGDDSGDFFALEFSTDGGNTFSTLASNGDSTSNADWATASAQVSAGDDVVVRVQCSDGAGPGDLVECGIDDVRICRN